MIGKEIIKKAINRLGYDLVRLNANATEGALEKCKIEDDIIAWPDLERLVEPCHYNSLFVNTVGEIYPCCATWNRKDMMIGHLDDNDLLEKIINFDAPNCECANRVIRPGREDDILNVNVMNLEMSLACQAQCAMCCVNAPEWNGSYDYYTQLKKLIEDIKPKEILVQGGEILIQKDAMLWLFKIKEMFPELLMSIGTNGNVDVKLAHDVEQLFYRMVITIPGFQPETYRRVVGLPVERVKGFAERMCQGKSTSVTLKYLTSPISIHETNLFLAWARELLPVQMQIVDATSSRYITMGAKYLYWEKIFERTGKNVRKELKKIGQDEHNNDETIIYIDSGNRNRNSITPKFVKENKLEDTVYYYEGRTPIISYPGQIVPDNQL